jgi:hypothetical protein
VNHKDQERTEPHEVTVHHRFGSENLVVLHPQYTCVPSRVVAVSEGE